MRYTLAEHARKVLAERNIPTEWLERTLDEPLFVWPDPRNPSLWVLDLTGRALAVYTEPAGDGYGALRTHRQGMVDLPWPAHPIDMADLVP